jgi:hypothetical protein
MIGIIRLYYLCCMLAFSNFAALIFRVAVVSTFVLIFLRNLLRTYLGQNNLKLMARVWSESSGLYSQSAR